MRKFYLILSIVLLVVATLVCFVIRYDPCMPLLLKYIEPCFDRVGLSLLAFLIAIISICLSIYDNLRVDPHIRKVWLFTASKNEYRILAEVSNEGGRKVKDCHCYIKTLNQTNKGLLYLDYVPVDTPAGRVTDKDGREILPKMNQFELYPKKPIYVRGYFPPSKNTKYQLVLEAAGNKIETPKDGFEFPDWDHLHELQRKLAVVGIASLEPI